MSDKVNKEYFKYLKHFQHDPFSNPAFAPANTHPCQLAYNTHPHMKVMTEVAVFIPTDQWGSRKFKSMESKRK